MRQTIEGAKARATLGSNLLDRFALGAFQPGRQLWQRLHLNPSGILKNEVPISSNIPMNGARVCLKGPAREHWFSFEGMPEGLVFIWAVQQSCSVVDTVDTHQQCRSGAGVQLRHSHPIGFRKRIAGVSFQMFSGLQPVRIETTRNDMKQLQLSELYNTKYTYIYI